jgi:ssDNA-binding Zn-finger/Zn-ribbon topoisomerase 1
MDLDDFLAMEDESAQRFEDYMKEHHCPKCDSVMEEKHSRKYGKYYRCNKCVKNYQVATP